MKIRAHPWLNSFFIRLFGNNSEGVESTSTIDTLLQEGNRLVTQLDALIRNKYKRNPDKLHAWHAHSVEVKQRFHKIPPSNAWPSSTPPPRLPTPRR